MRLLSVAFFVMFSGVSAHAMGGDIGTLFPVLSYPDTAPQVVSQNTR